MGSMEILETELKGVYIIKNPLFTDARGTFIKTYNDDLFNEFNICTDFKEVW